MSSAVFMWFNGKLNPRFWEQYGVQTAVYLDENEYVLFYDPDRYNDLMDQVERQNDVLGYEVIRDGRYDYLLKEREL